MENFLIIQMVGFLGYAIYALSGRLKTKKQIVLLEVMGAQICGFHWFLLGEMMPVYTNILNGLNGVAAVYADRLPLLKYLNYLTFPILVVIFYVVVGVSYSSTLTLLCSALFIGSRLFNNLVYVRLANIAAGIAVLLLGLMTLSMASVVFGLVHATVHISKLLETKTSLVMAR